MKSIKKLKAGQKITRINLKRLPALVLIFVLAILPLISLLSSPANAATYDNNQIITVGLYYGSSALSSVTVAGGTINVGTSSTSFSASSKTIEVGYSDGKSFTKLGETSGSSVNFGASSTFAAINMTVSAYNSANVSMGKTFALRFPDGALRINAANFYTGYFEIRTTSSGYLEIINVLPLDDYLKGVLPYEMSTSYPTEALKAQAVAARSWTFKNISKHKSSGFNLCSTTDCQAYLGCAKRTTKTDGAVDSTSGLVMTYNGKIAEGVYFSSSGGSTVSAHNFWGGSYTPYLTAVRVPEETGYMTWNFSMSMTELSAFLKARSEFSSLNGNIKSFEITSVEQNSDHVLALKATDSAGKSVTVSGGLKVYSIIAFLGRQKNKNYTSTNFNFSYAYSMNVAGYGESSYSGNIKVVTANGTESYTGAPSELKIATADGIESSGMQANSLVVNGKGWGHGVGMSQIGAKSLAEKGYDYEYILKRFYTGIQINKLSDL